jgi:glycerol-3-phosphate dehydrogenase subunit B
VKYDVIIIGGGIAGLTCGLLCQGKGLNCAVFSAGMSALHFSSGSIDLLGYDDSGKVIYQPFEALQDLVRERPEHPYARCGLENIEQALAFFKAETAGPNASMYANGRQNHFHVTGLGTLKPTYFSPQSVFDDDIKNVFESGSDIASATFTGFRDFHPDLAAANLRQHPLFKNRRIVTGRINLPGPGREGRPVYEQRSIDLARLFDQGRIVEDTARQIRNLAQGAGVVGIPAVAGLHHGGAVLKQLRELSGKLIYEIPTLPPSILGLRLDDAIKTRFAELGGVFIAGDRVIGGDITENRLDHIHTQQYGKARLSADYFVLASGSFFSGGLVSRFDDMTEPVFGLALDYKTGRGNWSNRKFLDPQSHPFLSFGVTVDEQLRPTGPNGQVVKNLYAAGAVLAGYNPIKEGCGGGVAIGTGYRAGLHILQETGRATDDPA